MERHISPGQIPILADVPFLLGNNRTKFASRALNSVRGKLPAKPRRHEMRHTTTHRDEFPSEICRLIITETAANPKI